MAIITFHEEKKLIKRLKNKDEEAFNDVVKRLQGRFFSVAFGIIGRREEAEDAVENTFLAAYLNIEKFQGNSALYSWLYRILVNNCYKKVKDKDFKVSTKLSSDDYTSEDVADDKDPFSEMSIDSNVLRKVITGLPKKFSDVLYLKVFEDLTYEEISKVLKIRRGTVMSRLYRARIMIQGKINKKGFVLNVWYIIVCFWLFIR